MKNNIELGNRLRGKLGILVLCLFALPGLSQTPPAKSSEPVHSDLKLLQCGNLLLQFGDLLLNRD